MRATLHYEQCSANICCQTADGSLARAGLLCACHALVKSAQTYPWTSVLGGGVLDDLRDLDAVARVPHADEMWWHHDR